MKNEIVIKKNSDIINIPKVKITSTGMLFDSTINFEEWEDVGNKLQILDKSIHFFIGDWLNYGENNWGEKYTQAIDETGFEYGTLANDKSVAKSIPQPIRKSNLSFEHHRVVAKLEPDDQEKWLDKASEEHWTVKELRKELNGTPRSENTKKQALVDLEIAAKNFCEKFGISRDELAIVVSLDEGERVVENGGLKVISEEIKTKLKFMFGK